MAVEIGLGQSDVATGQHLAEHRFIMHLQGDAVLARPEQAARPVGQANLEHPAGNPFEERENQAGIARRTVAAAQNHRVVHFGDS